LENSNNYSLNDIKEANKLVNKGTERVIELWNIVFMEFNRKSINKFSRLHSLVVDTGMGLERLCSVLNNLESNYDTDLFEPLFEEIFQSCLNNPKINNKDEFNYKK
jgi:alanyl-tRNA synthetase